VADLILRTVNERRTVEGDLIALLSIVNCLPVNERPGHSSVFSSSSARPTNRMSGAAQISPGEFTNPASQWGRSLTSRRG